MRPRQRLLKKIDEGMAFLLEQEKRLDPAIQFFTQSCLETMKEVSAEKKFEILMQLMNLKTENLLLLTKMKEMLEFEDI